MAPEGQDERAAAAATAEPNGRRRSSREEAEGAGECREQEGSHGRPLILITEPQNTRNQTEGDGERRQLVGDSNNTAANQQQQRRKQSDGEREKEQQQQQQRQEEEEDEKEEDQFEVVDGISYRIVAAVTTKRPRAAQNKRQAGENQDDKLKREEDQQQRAEATNQRRQSQRARRRQSTALGPTNSQQQQAGSSRLSAMRRKSSALVANLSAFLVPASRSSHELGGEGEDQAGERKDEAPQRRRMSIYEMTKSPPPETSIEMYLNERRRSSTVSATFVAQQLEQQSTFETNYCARQQYFKDLNEKLINQDKRLLNVVANRGQMHRHSVDIAQLPLELAQANAAAARKLASSNERLDELAEEENEQQQQQLVMADDNQLAEGAQRGSKLLDDTINQVQSFSADEKSNQRAGGPKQLASICEDKAQFVESSEKRQDGTSRRSLTLNAASERRERLIKKKFAQFDGQTLSSAPAPDVKIGQRVAYKEYYGNEFGTIRWIGRVPQISADWTVGVEFDNAIGEGDGSLHGRRYFIAKDCFAKFLPLASVALVDQHVGRPEPGTMISVMSAAVRPGQMISIQRVSTVHVQHCFLNAPHRRPGAEFLAVNTRLHCQCPNCGPCAHVVKPPRTQRLRTHKNATHMCQFSTYTCCGMESSEDALCTYTGNKISSLPPPGSSGSRLSNFGLPPIGNSWIEGSGYLSNLQAERRKLMPEEYRLGAAPEDAGAPSQLQRHGSGSRRHHHRHHHHGHQQQQHQHQQQHQDGHQEASGEPLAATLAPSSGGHANSNHNHHHQRRHRQHRKRHRKPDEKGDEQAPIYSNLYPANMQQQQQQELRTQMNHTSALQNCNSMQEKTFGAAANASERNELALVNLDKQNQELQMGSSFGSDCEAPMKPARFVYRDSIENRYLFPTDELEGPAEEAGEPIDSTLEADLENLSQARYGYFRTAPPNNRQRTRSSSPGSSRNLLVKSLRSLVSCLGASKTQSDYEQESTNSANQTLRIICRRPLSGGATPINKSQPALGMSGPFRSLSCASSSLRSSSPTTTNDEIGSATCSTNSSPSSGARRTRRWRQAPPQPPLSSHRPHGHMTSAHSHYYHNEQHFSSSATNGQQATRHLAELYDEPLAWQAKHQLDELDGIHATSMGATGQVPQATRRQKVSSSSDCGFSSASQTSANFLFTPSVQQNLHNQQTQKCAAELPFEEQRRLSAIYKRVAARLISSSSSQAPITSEDLQRLKANLFELQAQSQLHGSQGASLPNGSQLDCCEQLLAELIRKSYFQQSASGECQVSESLSSSPSVAGVSSQRSQRTPALEEINHEGQQIGVEGKQSGAAENTSNGLPRAFELKLTLSINENGKQVEQKAADMPLTKRQDASLKIGRQADPCS